MAVRSNPIRVRSADHRAEFAGDLGHLVAAEALAVEDGDFLLGAVDGVVNEIELDLQLLALFDLCAIASEQLLGFGQFLSRGGFTGFRNRAVVMGGHLHANGAQFAHDLVVMRSGVALCLIDCRHLAGLNSFNTESLTLDGHWSPHS